LKERVVDAKYDPVAWLGRKILGRKVAPLPPPDVSPSPIHEPPYAEQTGTSTSSQARSPAQVTAGASASGDPDSYWGPPDQGPETRAATDDPASPETPGT
jgi:hypothetical protein